MAVPYYDETNWHEFTKFLPDVNGEVDFAGHVRICNAQQPLSAPGGIACAPSADFTLIPRSEWPARIKQKDAEKSWPEDLVRGVIECNDQNGLPYCHGYGTVMAMMVARLIAGHPYVELSGEVCGGLATGWRRTGADPAEDLRAMVEHGTCPQKYIPQRHSINPNSYAPGWKEACADYRVVEWIDLRGRNSTDLVVTACLLGMACAAGFAWWSHFISGPYRIIDKGNGKFAIRYRNNWGASYGDDGFVDFDADGKGRPDWAFAVRAVTPDDDQVA